jgi:hypothetical protein
MRAPWRDIKAWSAFSDMSQDLAKVVRESRVPALSNRKDHDSFEAAAARLLEELRASEGAPVTASGASLGPVNG